MEDLIKQIKRSSLILVLCLLFIAKFSYAANRTIGVIQNSESAFDGYTLFSPIGMNTTYLLDNYGRVIHTWESDYIVDLSCYLLENGNLLRTFKTDPSLAGVQKLDWDGTVLWEYIYTTTDYSRHHDVEPLPNGNVLILAREYKTQSEAFQAGRNPSLLTTNTLWTEFIIEVSPTGLNTADVIWEWHLWDHLIQDYSISVDNFGVVTEHPELIDINFAYNTLREWIHANSIDYNAEFDQVLIGSRKLSEIWIIDHTTTSLEASGHSGGTFGKGGDFLYRWGNPQVYGTGSSNDREYYEQHDARWVENGFPGAGNILVYNNGNGRPEGTYSTVDEIILPSDINGFYTQPSSGSPFLPENQEWTYSGNGINTFFSQNISGSHRLSNGNTLICVGKVGHFIEVTTEGEIVWEYIHPIISTGALYQGDPAPELGNSSFRCHKYSPEFGILPEKELVPKGYLEINPVTFSGTIHHPLNPSSQDTVIVTSKISDESGIDSVELIVYLESDSLIIQMFDNGLNYDEVSGDSIYTAVIPPQESLRDVNYHLSALDESMMPFNDPPFASSTYNFNYYVNPAGTIDPVQNLQIEIDTNNVLLTWDSILGATNYNIYQSDFSDKSFIIVDSISDTTWSSPCSGVWKFFRVTASDE